MFLNFSKEHHGRNSLVIDYRRDLSQIQRAVIRAGIDFGRTAEVEIRTS